MFTVNISDVDNRCEMQHGDRKRESNEKTRTNDSVSLLLSQLRRTRRRLTTEIELGPILSITNNPTLISRFVPFNNTYGEIIFSINPIRFIDFVIIIDTIKNLFKIIFLRCTLLWFDTFPTSSFILDCKIWELRDLIHFKLIANITLFHKYAHLRQYPSRLFITMINSSIQRHHLACG